jgi:hypothetical protein
VLANRKAADFYRVGFGEKYRRRTAVVAWSARQTTASEWLIRKKDFYGRDSVTVVLDTPPS